MAFYCLVSKDTADATLQGQLCVFADVSLLAAIACAVRFAPYCATPNGSASSCRLAESLP